VHREAQVKAKLLQDQGEKTWAVIFDKGDEVVAGLTSFAKEQRLDSSHFTAIGAFQRATLAYFQRDRKEYKKLPIDEQVEVLSLVGDIAQKGDEPTVHAHVVVGREDGTTRGGHLLEAHVWPTLEVILTETPGYLRKRHDEETGLALIDPAAR
jgi:predicted DNA-binding protein with PD1-like motif